MVPQDGMCGIATTASYPIKTGPNPPKPPPVPQTCDLCADLPPSPPAHFSPATASVGTVLSSSTSAAAVCWPDGRRLLFWCM